MSTRSTAGKERRRKPEAVRREALEVGRRLLTWGGPGALTLKAVGAELGMSHANLIHHFGSAELFQAQLRDAMVEDLTRAVTALVRPGAGAAVDVEAIVAQVFGAYSAGGVGMLVGWSALSGSAHCGETLTGPLEELVAAVEPFVCGPDADGRAREIVGLVTLLAFADSLLGPALAERLGAPPQAIRALTVRLIGWLRQAPA